MDRIEYNPRIIFTPEEQAKINELIDRAYGKGMRKGAILAQTEIDRLKAEIAELKQKNKFSFWGR